MLFYPLEIIANWEIDIGDQKSWIKIIELFLIKVVLGNKT